MSNLNTTKQEVLKEMDYTASVLNSWNVSYTEKFQDFASPTLSSQYYSELVRHFPSRYNIHVDNGRNNTIPGSPLKTEVIEDYAGRSHLCEFRHIMWDILTNKSRRIISFKSNGDVLLEKKDKFADNPYISTKHKHNKITYQAYYNVNSPDFDLDIINDDIPVIMSLNDYGQTLTKKYGRFQIKEDLQTQNQGVFIDKDESLKEPYSARIYVTKNSLGKEMKLLNIFTYKPNGQIKGTYGLIWDGENCFYTFTSQKGNVFNLDCYNKEYFKFQHLFYSLFKDLNINRPTALLNYGEDWITSLDALIDYARKTVSNCDDVVKQTKGEMPLKGLQERIDSILNLKKEDNMILERKCE